MTDHEAGRRAAIKYHARYGQEGQLLRAGEMCRAHPKAEYAQGFWQQACKIIDLAEEDA